MFSTILGKVEGLVDKRLMLVAFFPVLVAVAIAAVLLAAANGGVSEWVDKWEGASGVTQALVVVGTVSGLLVVATMLSASSIPLLQVYEGYRHRSFAAAAGVALQKQRRAHLEQRRNVHLLYPNDDARLMPTRLGNVLRAAEDYPRMAYGADSVVLWPRLYLVLPADFRTSMSSSVDTVMFLLNVSLLSTLVGTVGSAFALVNELGRGVFLATLAGLLVAWITYQAACTAAIDYGLHVRAAFDLHRGDLLAKLRRPPPTTREEEVRLWRDLAREFLTGWRPPGVFTTAAPE